MHVTGPLPPNLPPAPASTPPAPRPEAPAAPAAAAPPAGASLWDLLTAEEREFFAEQAALGPLTYRPGGATPPGAPAPLGRRLDVKG
jgi:hypothetical protein